MDLLSEAALGLVFAGLDGGLSVGVDATWILLFPNFAGNGCFAVCFGSTTFVDANFGVEGVAAGGLCKFDLGTDPDF